MRARSGYPKSKPSTRCCVAVNNASARPVVRALAAVPILGMILPSLGSRQGGPPGFRRRLEANAAGEEVAHHAGLEILEDHQVRHPGGQGGVENLQPLDDPVLSVGHGQLETSEFKIEVFATSRPPR
jgi:hypothetical protein